VLEYRVSPELFPFDARLRLREIYGALASNERLGTRVSMFNQLSGATRLFPIIGDPVRYTESPVRLTRAFEERDYNAICIPLHVTEQSLDVVMSGLAATLNVDGILVTMPHKFAAFAHCSTSSERAQMLEVVSVIRRNPDRSWHGDMLDGLAFVTAQKNRGASVEGGRALLLGAGGAGRAIAVALLEAGVSELVVHDVVTSRVATLLDLTSGFGDDRLKAGPPDPTGCDLVFNATPLGMEKGDPLPIDVDLLRSSMFVGDVIAGHRTTPLVRAARDAGCTTADGDDMVKAGQNLVADFMLGR
jgi:shikimate dehydrogenase